MASPNSGKWKVYVDGSIMYGPAGAGQNMNVDLQQSVGNEADAIMREVAGPGVVTGFVVSAGAGLSVNIALGTAFVDGQRVANGGTAAVSSITANATVKIYVQATTPFSTALSAWPPSFGFTAGSLVGSQLLLATVVTGAATITSVTDARTLIETKLAQFNTISDATTPTAVATGLNSRLGMLAKRLKDIIGGADWLASVPSSLTTLATTLTARFHATTGHSHVGTTDNGPKLAQANTHQSPDTDSATSALHHTLGAGANQSAPGNHVHAASVVSNAPAGNIAATTVQAALNELDAEKALLVHAHAASDTTSGQFALARIATGSPTGAKFIRDDQTLQLPPGQFDLQVFTSTGTWMKPSWATANSIVEFIGYGGGKGGHSGGYDTGNGQSQGGNGGSGGAYGHGAMLAADLAGTESVVVGAGGAGGSGPGNAAPATGANGGDSTFKTFVARGGGNAFGGLGNSETTGYNGGPGGSGAVQIAGAPATQGRKAWRGGGGGGGGGNLSSTPGANGGSSAAFDGGTGGGGVAPGGVGAAGNSLKGGDGGGGGSNGSRQGGAGQIPGGGGGGGGSNGNSAPQQGTGGAGAAGKVWIITRGQ